MAHRAFLLPEMDRTTREWHQPPYGSVKKSGGSSTSPAGGHEETTFLIIDAQNVQNADTAMEKGYDAGKKVSGIKRHIAVDTQGLPHPLR